MTRLWLVAALLPSSLAFAQVTGSFSLEKSTFAPGEPVFLSFTLRNAGKQVQEIQTADPYSFCSGYKVEVTRDLDPEPACFQSSGGSCVSGANPLAPGASRTERILLNGRNTSQGDLRSQVKLAGDYTVDATRSIAFAPSSPDSRLFSAPALQEVHQTFHLRVDDALELSPAAYAPYVDQLSSSDEEVRREAARTLATFAPPALEPLLLSFATSKDYALKQFAPLALANLGSKASLSALASMLLHTDPGTYEYMMAADGLAKTHDPAWLPVLLEVAEQHGAMYLGYAAEAGGDSAIPTLLRSLRSPDANTRSAAIYDLGSTGSRTAVPILINLLPATSTDSTAAETALAADFALTQLTHLVAERDSNGAPLPAWHTRWQRWWQSQGSTATIYKPGGCHADTPLP